ncbi:nitrite reductase [Dietzia sp. ANT_WB102]|uniref:nitrite reductase n=1 Tax=Dietzia sp. ANT_WB102 TaxID=2597345 RepID=UPI0011EF81BC|nr:nitrite reductase [Dietzia sp. ANT_WB102]KAA0918435.1 nitrite reductase [Dietzia sp. ANT_WB102]
MSITEPTRRTRGDLCPGVLRPWPASDGALVRLRIPGGRLSPESLTALHGVAARYGDDDVHVTTRANLQLRALPIGPDGQLPSEVISAIAGTGLLPSPGHELVRNVLVSPLTGLVGGRADLRSVTESLDSGLLADPALGGLPGRFLFVLDDGRGDLVERSCDLGFVALDRDTVQLRVGDAWSAVVPLAEAVDRLTALARDFVEARGAGPEAPWHVRELTAASAAPLAAVSTADVRLPDPAGPLAYGPVPVPSDASAPSPAQSPVTAGIEHVEAPGGVLDRGLVGRLTGAGVAELIVTPWRGVLVVPE